MSDMSVKVESDQSTQGKPRDAPLCGVGAEFTG